MCAGINERIKKKMKEKSSNSNLSYGEFYRRFNSNFLFEIEYRTTVLSRGTYLIDLGCQSAKFEMNFKYERHFSTHTTLVHKTSLHWVGWSGPTRRFLSGHDRMIRPLQLVSVWTSLSKSGWSGPCPDDPDLELSERLLISEWNRMIRPLPRLSEPGSFWVCFSLFCYPPGWSDVTPDDPGTTENTHNGHLWGWEYIYTPSPLSFILLCLSDQPSSKSIHSLTLLHPKARFLQKFT